MNLVGLPDGVRAVRWGRPGAHEHYMNDRAGINLRLPAQKARSHRRLIVEALPGWRLVLDKATGYFEAVEVLELLRSVA